nr:MAG TPA: hypothetical protein [Caudoviricetes sp.]
MTIIKFKRFMTLSLSRSCIEDLLIVKRVVFY